MRSRTFHRRSLRPHGRARTVLLARIAALRLRLHGRTLLRRPGRRAATRIAPLERVMRRMGAVHASRMFAAHLALHIVLPARVLHRIEQLRGSPVHVRGLATHTRTQQVRTIGTRRELHPRLLERLAPAQAAAGSTHVSLVMRVEQPRAAPRLQLTMVHHQAAATRAVDAKATTTTHLHERAADAPQPRLAPSGQRHTLPPQELSRLTEHVIRQLDHRALSWQERTSRH